MSEYYIGLLSGTSIDAVDAALVDFSTSTPKLIATHNELFEKDLKAQLQKLVFSRHTSLEMFGKLDVALGKLFAQSVNTLLKKSNISAKDVIAIGSHGQTVFHHPNDENPFSMQIGDANIIATLTTIKTVADFRSKDITLGGQGAPLTPAFHEVLFRNNQTNRAIINLGGITNITYLPKNESENIIGFDSGPGNTLIDCWAEKNINKNYDENGQWAKSGKVNNAFLQNMLSDNYFSHPIPKSTGREYFNLEWVESYISSTIQPEDIQSTLTELTAITIQQHINTHAPQTSEIIICGGGAHNSYLVSRISQLLNPITVHLSDKYGVDPDWIEAMTFAWLAKQNINQKPGNLPSVTGASKSAILGSIYSP